MKIVAHRGGSNGTPENTLAAFRNALELRVDGVELDIQLSKDGVPVVIHDTTLDRTTNGTGEVNRYTFEELQQFDAGDGETIPYLGDVLDLIADRVFCILELKSLEAAPAAIEEIRKRPTLRWVGLSGIPEALDAYRAAFPAADLAVGTLGSKEASLRLLALLDDSEKVISAAFRQRIIQDAENFDIEDVLTRAAVIKAVKIGVYWEAVDSELVKLIHSRGFQVGPWTVNDPIAAERLMGFGVDTLTTDDPATMMTLRQAALTV